MIEKLRKINDDIIETSIDAEVINRHIIIKSIFDDDNCFFKMDIEHAYSILRDLGIPESEVTYIYMKLIDPSEMKQIENNSEV